MYLTESLLHFIWRFRLFDSHNLKTLADEKIIVYDVGQSNPNAGPDFMFAKVKIAETIWSGQVEIHIKEEDWLLHKHQLDKSYDNTILHVVWESASQSILRTDGTNIPTLRIKDYVDLSLLDKYKALMSNLDWIPCCNQLNLVRPLTIQHWLSRIAVARLEEKIAAIQELLKRTNYDWESVFLIVLGRSFGMKVNADAFETLCIGLDIQLINKYKNDQLKLESILFGLAGFLDHPLDEYTMLLQKEFLYLQHLHHLKSMSVEEWRFMRMRPYNFPTFRLGQLVALLQYKSYWFDYVLEADDLVGIFDVIDRSIVNSYWQDHYRFNVKTEKHSVAWSSSFKNHLVINCVIPMLFAYADYMKIEKYKNKAIDWLNELPAEINQITKKYAQYDVLCQNAADSQALLHLKKQYCDNKKCLECAIGLEILKVT